MNNFKKFAAVLLGVVMACVFATSAFADTASDKADIIAKMNAAGLTGYEDVINSLSDNGVAVLKANKDTLIAQANQVQAYLNDNHSATEQAANLEQALNNVKGILNNAGIDASVSVSVQGNTVVATAKASTATASASKTVTETVDPSKETNKAPAKETTAASNEVKAAAKNTVVATASGNANPIAASSTAVIKATGDNSAMVMVVAALAVAGVLGMAVRKESTL